MTIKELKVKFPPEEYGWHYIDVDNNWTEVDIDNDNDIVLWMSCGKVFANVYRRKSKPILSKAKLDRVIELNREYFLSPVGGFERNNAVESLREAENDCGKEIRSTGLLDIVGTIISSTKERNTPNEKIYKVYEALGYVVE